MTNYFRAITLGFLLTAIANPAYAARLSFNDDHNSRHHDNRDDDRNFRFDHDDRNRWASDEHWNDFFHHRDERHDRDFRGRLPFEFYAFEHDRDHHGRFDDDFGFHFGDRRHHHEFSEHDWRWLDHDDWRWHDAHWHHHHGDPGDPGDPSDPLATPLPASWLLFGTGLLLFAGYTRVKRAALIKRS